VTVEPALMSDPVLTEIADRVMVITINRPQAQNALDRSAAEAIAAAVDHFESSDELAVAVLTGAGGTFCAGMDLKAFLRGESPSIEGRGLAGITERPPSKPLIAAVEGWALAGGCELALSADVIVASTTAKFGLPEVKRGLVAAAGGLMRLPKTMSYSRAMLLGLTGDPISAVEAERHGLVTILAESGHTLSTAVDIASRIAANGPLAVRATKKIIATQANWTDPAAFAWQRSITEPVKASEDAREGARAFAEKRAPQWSGR
jgi:enoyl-CoA hydratase